MSLSSTITAFDFFSDCLVFAILLSIAFLFILHLLISLTDLINAPRSGSLRDRDRQYEDRGSVSYSQIKDLMQSDLTSSENDFIIDASEFLDDVTTNYIFDSPDYHNLPSDIFEGTLFDALNDLIDDFAMNTHRYIKPQHLDEIDRIAIEYLYS